MGNNKLFMEHFGIENISDLPSKRAASGFLKKISIATITDIAVKNNSREKKLTMKKLLRTLFQKKVLNN